MFCWVWLVFAGWVEAKGETVNRLAENGFYERLRKFSVSGLIGKDYVLYNDELVMVRERDDPLAVTF